jgi:hypothetical protein
MLTLILSIACAAGAGCDYNEYKVAEFHNRNYGSSMCSALSNVLMLARTPQDKERDALFRCLDNDDPKNEGRQLYISNAPQTILFLETCPLDERSGRFKKQGSAECEAQDIATFYGDHASEMCKNRLNNTQPVYAANYDIRAFTGYLSCATMDSEADAL